MIYIYFDVIELFVIPLSAICITSNGISIDLFRRIGKSSQLIRVNSVSAHVIWDDNNWLIN